MKQNTWGSSREARKEGSTFDRTSSRGAWSACVHVCRHTHKLLILAKKKKPTPKMTITVILEGKRMAREGQTATQLKTSAQSHLPLHDTHTTAPLPAGGRRECCSQRPQVMLRGGRKTTLLRGLHDLGCLASSTSEVRHFMTVMSFIPKGLRFTEPRVPQERHDLQG